jgi:hypothetical protein
VDISKGEMTVKTKGLYRVVYHNAAEGDFVNDELLSLKEAYWWANWQNNYYHSGCRNSSEAWAEIISYKDWVKREKVRRELGYRNDEVERRLKEIKAEKAGPQPDDEPTKPLIHVLEVGDGTAQVSTAGLVKVVIQPSGRVVKELYDPESAKAYVNSFNCGGRKSWAEIVSYPQAG